MNAELRIKSRIGSMHHSRKAFTLIEILLGMGLFMMVAVVSIPLYQTFLFQNERVNAANVVVNASRKAQQHARAVRGDGVWGVKILSGQVIVFKGATYATRDTTEDELTEISTGVSATGLTEYTFTKVFGDPSTTGTIVMTGQNGEVQNLVMNSKGVFNY